MFIEATPPPDEAARRAEEQALLKQDLMEVSAQVNTNITQESFIADFAESEKESQKLETQLNSPVSDPYLAPQVCNIGNWNGMWILEPDNEYSEIAKVPERPRDVLTRDDITIEDKELTQEDVANGVTFGSYKAEFDQLTVHRFSVSEETANFITEHTQQSLTPETAESKVNNVLRQLSVLYHENLHRKHNIYDGMGKLGDTPINTIKEDRLTETTAKATEYLAIAQLYTTLKEQGVKNLDIDGEIKPLESMLDLCPNLRETIEKNGFNVNDPQSVRNVVKAASDYWHDEIKPLYEEQHANAATHNVNENVSFSTQLRTSKEDPEKRYQKTSKRMLSNVYIGSNTYVDLNHCRDLLDTMSNEEAQQIMNNHNITPPQRPSQETLMAVDKYLEQKGAHTDEEKQAMLEVAFIKIVDRAPDADQELKKIMLQNGGSIKYSDGLVETHIPNSNLVTIGKDKGKTFVLHSFTDFSKKPEKAHTNENTASTQKEEKSNNNQLNQQQVNYLINQARSR